MVGEINMNFYQIQSYFKDPVFFLGNTVSANEAGIQQDNGKNHIRLSLHNAQTVQNKRIVIQKEFVKGDQLVEIVLEKNVRAQIMDFVGSSALKINLSEGSHLEYFFIDLDGSAGEQKHETTVSLKELSHVRTYLLSQASHHHQFHLRVVFEGSQAEAGLFSAGIGERYGMIEQTSSVEHLVGSCRSEQLYKYVLQDESKSFFEGRIYMAPNAQKSNSSQLVQNLLMGDRVVARSKPILQIHADDVKATHGATNGQANEDEIFYLQSRGISKDKARGLLNQAFLSEIILRIQNPEIRNFCQILFGSKNISREKVL